MQIISVGTLLRRGRIQIFIIIYECKKENRGKVKIKKWLGIPNLSAYEKYIADWHRFLLDCEAGIQTLDEENTRILNLYVLKMFYQTAYESEEFYGEFYERLQQVKNTLGI